MAEKKQLIAGRYEPRSKLVQEGPLYLIRAYDRGRGDDVLMLRLPTNQQLTPDRDEGVRRAAAAAIASRAPGRVPALALRNDPTGRWLAFALPQGENAWLGKGGARKDWETVRRIGAALSQAVTPSDRGPRLAPLTPKQVWIQDDGGVSILDLGPLREAGLPESELLLPGESDFLSSGSEEETGARFVAALLFHRLMGQAPRGQLKSMRKLRSDLPGKAAAALDQALAPAGGKVSPSLARLRAAFAPPARKQAATRTKVPWLAATALVLLAAGGFVAWQQGLFSGGTEPARPASRAGDAGSLSAAPQALPREAEVFLGRIRLTTPGRGSSTLELRRDGTVLRLGGNRTTTGTWRYEGQAAHVDFGSRGSVSLHKAASGLQVRGQGWDDTTARKTHWLVDGVPVPAVTWTSPGAAQVLATTSVALRGRIAHAQGATLHIRQDPVRHPRPGLRDTNRRQCPT